MLGLFCMYCFTMLNPHHRAALPGDCCPKNGVYGASLMSLILSNGLEL